MATNLRKIALYGLAIFLVMTLAMIATGCIKTATQTATATVSPSASSATTRSPRIPEATGSQPNPGVSSTPSVTASTSLPAVTAPTPSSAISTAIPVLPSSGPTNSIGVSPVLLVTAPLDVSTVPAGDITVSIIIPNFNLVNKIGQASISGEGHIIYYMDATPPTVPNQTALTSAGTYVESTTTTYTWHNVAAGTHFFSVQLVNNDSTPLITPIAVTLYVRVQGSTQPNPSPS